MLVESEIISFLYIATKIRDVLWLQLMSSAPIHSMQAYIGKVKNVCNNTFSWYPAAFVLTISGNNCGPILSYVLV